MLYWQFTVALLAINTDRQASHAADLPTAGEQYTLTAKSLADMVVKLNGNELKLGANDALPQLIGTSVPSGKITFAPASMTFLAVPEHG